MSEILHKHGLELIPTKDMSRAEWLQARMDGLGGSDMSSILGLNYRFSALELFYQKVGLTKQSQEQNAAIFWGNVGEPHVLDIGQYYDLDTGEYIDNYESGKKLRKITSLRYMVRNPKYPHILANLDGAVNFRPRNFKMEGPAEAKTISRQTAEMWVDGVPPYHIIQIMTYCLVCEPMMVGDAAYIFYLQDGREFRGYRIPVVPYIVEQVIERSTDFWERVVKGREIMATVSDYDTRLKYLAQIEPEPDSSYAYYDFMSELFKLKESFIRIEAEKEDMVNALMYKKLHEESKQLDAQKQEFKNKLIKRMHDNGANVIDMAGFGRVTWNRRLYVNVNVDMLNEMLQEDEALDFSN